MNKKDLLLLFGVLPAGIVAVVLFTLRQTAPPELPAPTFEVVSNKTPPEDESKEPPPSPPVVEENLPDPVFVSLPPKPAPVESLVLDSSKVEPGEGVEQPSVASAKPPAENRQPSVFPSEERIWTNLSGKIMLAAVIDYDAERNVILLRDNKGQFFPDYAVSQLSAADRKFLEDLVNSEDASKN